MKIEVLFPEFCNLYGDISNIDYLKKCVPEAEVIYTAIDNEPAFLTQNVNLIYLGPLTERKQEIVIEKLMPYKEKICRSDRYFNCIAYRYTYRTSQRAAWNTAIYCRCNRNTFILRGAKSI